MAPHPAAQLAVSKIPKYASLESGDTVEIVERPHGGLSAVLVDGQRSGRSAKNISNLVMRKAISLLAEGVRDGSVARAAHDYLRTYRSGKVSAEMQIVSLDLESRTLVVSRNCQCPCWIRTPREIRLLNAASAPIGIHRIRRPDITEMMIESGTTVVAASDGIWQAGRSREMRMDLPALLKDIDPDQRMSARAMSRRVLDHALALDEGRAQDDLTVIVVKIVDRQQRDDVRHMAVDFPLG